MRNEKEILEIYQRNVDAVYRISLSYLKNPQDAEDVVQNTFLKMIEKNVEFHNKDHERGWLILTAANSCKNHLVYWFSRKRDSYELLDLFPDQEKEDQSLLELVLSLPQRYKATLYLYYYEGFDTKEIAKLLTKSPSTVRTHLERGRKYLRTLLEEENDHEK